MSRVAIYSYQLKGEGRAVVKGRELPLSLPSGIPAICKSRDSSAAPDLIALNASSETEAKSDFG